MTSRLPFIGACCCGLLLALAANLTLGADALPPAEVWAALFDFDETKYEHFVVLYQRLPRALIAIFVGAILACGGAVLQGLTRNPLASPSILGVHAGATLFVVAGVFLFNVALPWQGALAIAGGIFGFASCLFVTRLTGMANDPRGLALILSGAVLSMLYLSIANVLLLSSPSRRNEFLSWIAGNINHVYAERLYDFWWIGLAALAVLFVLARPLTLVVLGRDKAASAGVNVPLVMYLALAAVVISGSAAVAVCGPVGFVGLIVPHIVRPFAGAVFASALPANALLGAAVCLLADLTARTVAAPHILHTGVMMDLIGGVVFAVIVHRRYLTAGARKAV